MDWSLEQIHRIEDLQRWYRGKTDKVLEAIENGKIKMLSRLVSAKEATETFSEMKDGTVDIVIGTHALLSKKVEFANLGLLIIDEEQHFGVVHKEKLKNLKSGVHVLTMTATPIPRTLQLSLTGVKNLSVITTPPVDRLAVRSFVMPFDKVMIKEPKPTGMRWA